MKNNKSISSNMMWRFAERLLAQLVSFAVSLVLARLLLPQDYGVVSLVLVFIEIANVFVTNGLGNSLVQKKNADELDFSSSFYFNLLLSAGLYLLLFIFSPLISGFFEQESLVLILRVLGIKLVFAAINSIQQAYISRQMAFKKFFWATFFGTFLSGVIGIWMAYCGFGAWALVAQYLINSAVDTVILWIVVKWRPKPVFSWARVRSLFKFGWKILFESLSSTLANRIRNLVIGKVYSEADLGYYTKAQQFPNLFMTNINASVSSVLFPAMSGVQDEGDRILLLLRRSVKILSYLLFPILFGMSAVAANMVNVLLTDKWAECVPYIYIICGSLILSVGMYPRHQALNAKGRSDIFMIEHFLSRVFNLLILFLVYKISVLAIALSGIGGSLILAIIVMHTSKKYSGYRYRDQAMDVAGVFLMSVAMFVPTFAFGWLVDLNPVLELALQILIGVVVYLILSLAFRPEGYNYIIVFAKRFFLNKQRKG